MKNYTVAGAIAALNKKGVIITQEKGLTKRETTYEPISMANVGKTAKQVGLSEEEIVSLKMKGTLLTTLGITPKKVMRELTVQQPMTVNVGNASDLGNGSWGKIDFLTNHCGFTLTNQFIDNLQITYVE
jgi:hypothetical protein